MVILKRHHLALTQVAQKINHEKRAAVSSPMNQLDELFWKAVAGELNRQISLDFRTVKE